MNDTTVELDADTIQAYPVPEAGRIATLSRHFHRHMLTFEGRVYDFMHRFAKDYGGGYWRMVELSNSGFYMSPPGQTYHLFIETNGFDNQMSADAAGITVCLFAYSHLSFEYTTDLFARHYHRLLAFAGDHREAGLIFQAID